MSAYTDTDFFFFFFEKIYPKRVFPAKNGKIALVRASMVVTYYMNFFRRESTDTSVF